jgi:hypothetical protein
MTPIERGLDLAGTVSIWVVLTLVLLSLIYVLVPKLIEPPTKFPEVDRGELTWTR